MRKIESSKHFSLRVPELPRLNVFNPDIKWHWCEWYNERYLGKEITNFEEALVEAKKEFIKIREEDLDFVKNHLPDYLTFLEETYPKDIVITFREVRVFSADN